MWRLATPLRSKLSSAILEQGRELGPSDRLVMQAILNHPVRALHTRGDEFPDYANSEAEQSPEALSGLEDRPQRFTDRRGLLSHHFQSPHCPRAAGEGVGLDPDSLQKGNV